MSKKSRRARAKFRAVVGKQDSSLRDNVKLTKPIIEPRVKAYSVRSPDISAKDSLHEYIIPDLRNIGIISGALFILLIILWWVIK